MNQTVPFATKTKRASYITISVTIDT